MSKIPSLEEVLKLYTKKDLWNRIQEKNKQIAELQKQLEASETQNKRVLEKLELITKSNQELEKQLEEKDKRIEILQKHFKKTQELLAREMGNSNIVIDNLQKEMKMKLADQKDHYENKLKSQAEEIVEKIRKWGQKHYNWVGDGTGYDGQEYNECIGFNKAIDQLNEVLDTILKDYAGE